MSLPQECGADGSQCSHSVHRQFPPQYEVVRQLLLADKLSLVKAVDAYASQTVRSFLQDFWHRLKDGGRSWTAVAVTVRPAGGRRTYSRLFPQVRLVARMPRAKGARHVVTRRA
eukprot:COSAG02_NODE_42808_length_381_cov_0.677305_1_plen_113_part_01